MQENKVEKAPSVAMLSPEAIALLIRRVPRSNLQDLLKNLSTISPFWSDPIIVAISDRMKEVKEIPPEYLAISDEGAYQARVANYLDEDRTIEQAIEIHNRYLEDEKTIAQGLREWVQSFIGEKAFSSLVTMLFPSRVEHLERFLITLFAPQLFRSFVEKADAVVQKKIQECKGLCGNEKTKKTIEVLRGLTNEKASNLDFETMKELLGAVEGATASMLQNRGIGNIRLFLNALVTRAPAKTFQDLLYSYELLTAVQLQEKSDSFVNFLKEKWSNNLSEMGTIEIDPFDVKDRISDLLPEDVSRLGKSLATTLFRTLCLEIIGEALSKTTSDKIKKYYDENRFWEYSGTFPTAATTIRENEKTVHELAESLGQEALVLLRRLLVEKLKSEALAGAFVSYITEKPWENDDALVDCLFSLILRVIWTRLERESKKIKH